MAYNEKHTTKAEKAQDELSGQPGMTSREPIYRAEGPDDDIAGPSPISALVESYKIPGALGTESPDYLELLANVSKSVATAKLVKSIEKSGSPGGRAKHFGEACKDRLEGVACSPGYFIRGQCENGHHFAKEILCGREWCPVCGEDDSVAHKRRVARWLPKAQQISSMGYFVFTIPMHTRELYRTKKKLGLLTKKLTAGDTKLHIVGVLKSMGFDHGLCRWHWFGDKSEKYNPHLNVIVEAGFLPEAQLDAIKAAWAGILGVEMADVFYEYTDEPGKMMHIVQYATRATFHKLEWDGWLAAHIWNFRNMRAWGSWDGQPVWAIQGKEKLAGIMQLEAGICPICKTAIRWRGKPLPMPYLRAWGDAGMALPLGAGYWQLPGD